MFPDSLIAKSYQQAKLKYSIQFGIAPSIKKKLIYDICNTVFSFKFDETTNSMARKQFDGYFQYWSKRGEKVSNSYYGLLFMGHSSTEQIAEPYEEICKDIDWATIYLLLVGMDGPQANLALRKTERNDGALYLQL